ncbi:tetratricopeptide repeat protein [Anaerotalea alkaliphila]|uniref:Tetratricopeptide repeat protein n=1 Tax=Anaerotalea alkaliphila TaxID=2662126 RepID=A0A7X5KMY1_9FIRM|nr:tetratricopeptide repeat protein [Anaerotalea alkaliphila]NDL68431.1 tetratricopeptide repeat protein [Anaerotalea alkaliphila]
MKRRLLQCVALLAALWVLAGCSDGRRQRYAQGMELYREGNLQEAREVFEAGLAEEGDYGPYHLGRALVAFEEGDTDQALADLDTAIALDPDDGLAYSKRGYIHLGLGYRNAASEDLQNALERVRTIRDREERYQLYLNLGTLRREMRDPEAALKWYKEALALEKRDPGLYNALGMVHMDLGDGDAAMEMYGNAIDLDPGNAYAFGNRAVAFESRGQLELALSDAATGIRLDPGIPQLYLVKARVERELQDPAAAEQTLLRAVERWSGYGDAHLLLGEILFEQEDHLQAIVHFSHAKDAGNQEGHFWMGEAYRALGQPQDAIGAYRTYLDTEEGVANLEQGILGLGIAYKENGNGDLALETVEQLLARNPQHPQATELRSAWMESKEE